MQETTLQVNQYHVIIIRQWTTIIHQKLYELQINQNIALLNAVPMIL